MMSRPFYKISVLKKVQNVISILLLFIFFTSCSSKSNINLETNFLKFYFSENYKTDIVIINANNSNAHVLKTLKRHANNELKQDDLTRKLLIMNGLKRVKEQTVNNTEWNRDIEKSINRIKITSEKTNVIYTSKPIFVDNYCLIYSYKKTDEVYFIPSIEVFLNEKGWKKIGKISPYK